jgi:hypothetical protein
MEVKTTQTELKERLILNRNSKGYTYGIILDCEKINDTDLERLADIETKLKQRYLMGLRKK